MFEASGEARARRDDDADGAQSESDEDGADAAPRGPMPRGAVGRH
jgi:hypothetical protein